MPTTTTNCFGTVRFEDPDSIESCPPGRPNVLLAVTREQGQWQPPDRLQEWLPEGFSLPIDCYRGSGDVRRFIPRCSWDELVELGAVGGLAVLHGVRGFNREADYSYRAMFRILQYVRGRAHRDSHGMQEHHTREFDYSRDLYVRRLSRIADDERDVLPDDIGLNSLGEGRRLTVKQLTELGRDAAREAGHANPTSSVSIAYGLYTAAQRHPVELDAGEVPVLVRRALFDITDAKPPEEKVVELVTERLLGAINKHLDDSQEDFEHWFLGPNNSLVKQIAQQRKRGGPLSRKEVRHALLFLGWRAYAYVGQCVNALMRTIKNAILDSLSDEEKRVFELMHESWPLYGNLPLALLSERSSTIGLAVTAIWTEPDNRERVGVVHRLLAYYGDMAEKRRQADRRSKAASW